MGPLDLGIETAGRADLEATAGDDATAELGVLAGRGPERIDGEGVDGIRRCADLSRCTPPRSIFLGIGPGQTPQHTADQPPHDGTSFKDERADYST